MKTMKTIFALAIAAATLQVLTAATLSTPALATDLEGAKKLCETRGSCAIVHYSDGSVTFGVDNGSNGFHVVDCPASGPCKVIVIRGPGKGTVAGGSRVPVGGETLKPESNPPPRQPAGPIRVKPPVSVSGNSGGSKPTLGTIQIARANHK
jgi:hypothetical protein